VYRPDPSGDEIFDLFESVLKVEVVGGSVLYLLPGSVSDLRLGVAGLTEMPDLGWTPPDRHIVDVESDAPVGTEVDGGVSHASNPTRVNDRVL